MHDVACTLSTDVEVEENPRAESSQFDPEGKYICTGAARTFASAYNLCILLRSMANELQEGKVDDPGKNVL